MIKSAKVNYSHITKTYDLGYIYNLFQMGKINTELECQRGYVWNEERQQGLFDSLLRGHRIPEFHAIKEGLKYNIIDGKQRITTIMRILNDEIPLKRSYAKDDIKQQMLQTKRSQLFFSDLDSQTKDYVLDTSVQFAEYTDVQDEEISVLFQKLNAGKALNKVGISLLENLLIRKYFTSFIIDKHPLWIDAFTQNQKEDATDEASLIRLMHLLENEGSREEICNLDASELGSIIKNKDKEEIEAWRNYIIKVLNEFDNQIEREEFKKVSASFMPFLIAHFSSISTLEKSKYSDFIGYYLNNKHLYKDNRNLTPQVCKNRLQFIESLFSDYLLLCKK